MHKAPTSLCHNFINMFVFIHEEKSCPDVVHAKGGSRILQTMGHRLADVYYDVTVMKSDVICCTQMFTQLLEYC